MSFVIIQHMGDGTKRVGSFFPLDVVTAMQTHRVISQAYPQMRFEIVPATRSIRRQLAGPPVISPGAKKFCAKIGMKLGGTFAAAFLKSLKSWPFG